VPAAAGMPRDEESRKRRAIVATIFFEKQQQLIGLGGRLARVRWERDRRELLCLSATDTDRSHTSLFYLPNIFSFSYIALILSYRSLRLVWDRACA
jgi:hypothetical protein